MCFYTACHIIPDRRSRVQQQQLYSYPKIENLHLHKINKINVQIKSNEYMAARNNHTGLIRNWAALLSV